MMRKFEEERSIPIPSLLHPLWRCRPFEYLRLSCYDQPSLFILIISIHSLSVYSPSSRLHPCRYRHHFPINILHALPSKNCSSSYSRTFLRPLRLFASHHPIPSVTFTPSSGQFTKFPFIRHHKGKWRDIRLRNG